MPESLLQELQERIRSTGPMPFVDYMQLALYHPRHGYYTTRVPGHGVDYATAPTITPWFGRLVRRELHRMWEALGQPDPFTIVEVGAGSQILPGRRWRSPAGSQGPSAGDSSSAAEGFRSCSESVSARQRNWRNGRPPSIRHRRWWAVSWPTRCSTTSRSTDCSSTGMARSGRSMWTSRGSAW